jgi:hypothetical protein
VRGANETLAVNHDEREQIGLAKALGHSLGRDRASDLVALGSRIQGDGARLRREFDQCSEVDKAEQRFQHTAEQQDQEGNR